MLLLLLGMFAMGRVERKRVRFEVKGSYWDLWTREEGGGTRMMGAVNECRCAQGRSVSFWIWSA